MSIISYVSLGVSIFTALILFLVSYRLAKRRRGVRLGVGIAVLAFGSILSHHIYGLEPAGHYFLVSIAVAIVLTFIGGLAIGTAVYPRPVGTERDIV